MRLLILGLCVAITLIASGCASKATTSAPDFKLQALEDSKRTVSLQDFKDKTVLVDFWATWCGPCRMSMPEIQSVWDKYHQHGLEVVSVSAEDRETIQQFENESKFSYPIFIDLDGSMNRAYDVQGIPRFVLIKDGKIVWQQEGYAQGSIASAVDGAMKT